MTAERIAAAIKPILDEDRRADRERIADLERDLAALRAHDKATRGAAIAAAIADAVRREPHADGGLRDLRVAALQAQHALVDQDMLIADLNKQLDELTEKCAALVVERDRLRSANKRLADSIAETVETPAVEVKVDGWVVYDPSDAAGQPFRFAYGWQESSHSTNSEPFKSFEAAHEWMAFVGGRGYVAIPLAAAHAIEAATKEDAR